MSAPAYKVRLTHADGTVTFSPRFSFRSVASTCAVEQRREPGVVSAVVVALVVEG